MAKITIEIEDSPSGQVKVTMTPSFETMMKMAASGHELTSAHAYALCAVNQIRREAKSQDPTKIIIPKVSL